MNLPKGTITFLFTDIESSTRLWEHCPEAMRLALARHDLLLREALEKHHGYVFKTVGDAFCAAFATSSDAVDAALEAHLALQEQEWEETGPLRVRMGLHTGEAEERDNDYFGQTLNRAARLQGVGHGQQTLLSLTTYQLVRDNLPPSVSVVELGSHRLKDLQRPEQVFQLVHPALPSEFPPLKSLDNPKLPNNLPQQLTSFVGREREMAEVRALLSENRLLTLLGIGGTGKSRLSLQVAADMLDGEGDGVWLVELAALTDPALVPQAAAQVLGVPEQPGKTITQCLVEHLKDKQLLLLLDNCEHLIDACARLADTLLKNSPKLRVLATSREPLGIAGEQVYRLSTLSVPQAPERATADNLSQYEAVQLFIERAGAVQPSFTVTNTNAPALAQVCVRLDGIPLALELAAARIRSLSVQEINTRLDSRFRLLTGGSRTALPRQQTLRALIDWSYDLLSPGEKALLCRLSVFSGGWTLEAAEQVCSDPDTEGVAEGASIEAWEMLDLLTSLSDKSLVVYQESEGATRYRLLETVRTYALEKLNESGESVLFRQRHLEYYRDLAEHAEPHLAGGRQTVWAERLDFERDNLAAAIEWSLASGVEGALRITGALGRFWLMRGSLTEGRSNLVTALDYFLSAGRTHWRAKALHWAGVLAGRQGDYTAARVLYEESLAIRGELGDKCGVADSLTYLGVVSWNQGDYEEARSLLQQSLSIRTEIGDRQGAAFTLENLGVVACHENDYGSGRSLFEECLAIYKEQGDRYGVAGVLINLGSIFRNEGDHENARTLFAESLSIRTELRDRQGIAGALACLGVIAQEQGDYTEAHAHYEEVLAIRRELGDRLGIAQALNNMGNVAKNRVEHDLAETYFAESLAIRRELGNKQGVSNSLENLGHIACARGDFVQAHALYTESLTILRELGDKVDIAYSLEAFARLAVSNGQPERAAMLLGAGAALRASINSPLPPNERDDYECHLRAARRSVGEAAFDEALLVGQAMTPQQAIAYALEEAKE